MSETPGMLPGGGKRRSTSDPQGFRTIRRMGDRFAQARESGEAAVLKVLGFLLFVALIWVGLSAVVGEPDPWTARLLERVGVGQSLPGGESRSVGQRARGQMLDAYRTGQQRAWLEDDRASPASGDPR